MLISQLLEAKGRFVATVPPSTSVRAVVSALTNYRVGALVISSDGHHVDGIAAERDIVRALHRFGPAILDEPVRVIMSTPVWTCAPDERVEQLAMHMTEHRIRHVPVLDHGELAGIVSVGDIVKSRIDELEAERRALEDYISAR